MTDILQSVVEPDGTGSQAAVEGVAIAGKTGSTNSNKDMWFCGYSPYYTLAVWMGYDYPQVIHGNNKTVYIFKEYMEQVHKTLPPMGFNTNISSGTNNQNITPTQDKTIPEETQSQTDENNEQSTTQQETESLPQETTPSDENNINPDSDMDATDATGGDMDATGGNLGGDIDAPSSDADISNGNLGGDMDAPSVDADG